jgi:HAD superfamily hydrolase (TIGR01549 family)
MSCKKVKKGDSITVAVLFDLEGTLVQTEWEKPEHIVLFRGETRQKLLNLGIPPTVLEGDERSTVMRNNALDYAKQNFERARIKQFQLEMQRFLEKYEMSAVKTSRLFPETLSTLRQMKALGCCIGLVTNTSRKAVTDYFSMYPLGNYFDVAVTRDHVSKLKPDPEGVLFALKELGMQRFFLVGDLEHDAIAARKAGGVSIIVNRDSSRLPLFKADFFVKSLHEVPVIISSNMRRESFAE